MTTDHSPITDWLIRPLAGLSTGRPAGFDVYRVHAPYTDAAKVEPLNPGRPYRTEAEARAAIARATV